jgi:hypothetical protein
VRDYVKILKEQGLRQRAVSEPRLSWSTPPAIR